MNSGQVGQHLASVSKTIGWDYDVNRAPLFYLLTFLLGCELKMRSGGEKHNDTAIEIKI